MSICSDDMVEYTLIWLSYLDNTWAGDIIVCLNVAFEFFYERDFLGMLVSGCLIFSYLLDEVISFLGPKRMFQILIIAKFLVVFNH